MASQDMLINHIAGEECRIAIVEKDKLEELYTERASDNLHVSNIYRGRVTNIEPSIQAAFIDFGLERNGFLHISDLHPKYFPGDEREMTEKVGLKTPRKDRPPIQHCLKRGQQILVQVLKEGIGTKGPTLTSYLSIPGRFLVMMPNMEQLGVTRKIEDDETRKAGRKVLEQLDVPKGFGFILRTAGIGRNKTELKRDLSYLQRLWKDIDSEMKRGKGPRLLYTESDLIIRTLRDVMTTDVKRIIVDDYDAATQVKNFLRIAMPRSSTKVIYYDRHVPLFDSFGIESQVQSIKAREVKLPNGGSLVFDQTEALVAIDVNSGKYRDNKDAEMTAFLTNKEAVDEIARQLRLRDLGGVIVLDLIDMYKHSHRRQIEKMFRDAIKKDRARTKPLKINDIGLLTLTRQRMRPSLKKAYQQECPTCQGMGAISTPEAIANEIVHKLQLYLNHDRVDRIELKVSHDVAALLFNRKREVLQRLESQTGKLTEVVIDTEVSGNGFELICYDNKRVHVDTEKLGLPNKPQFSKEDEVSVEEAKKAAQRQSESVEDMGESESSKDKEQSSSGKDSGGEPKPSSKSRRRRKHKPSQGENQPAKGDDSSSKKEENQSSKDDGQSKGDKVSDSEQKNESGGKRKRKRRRGRGKGKVQNQDKGSGGGDSPDGGSGDSTGGGQSGKRDSSSGDGKSNENEQGQSGDGGGKRRRRRRRRKPSSDGQGDLQGGANQGSPSPGADSKSGGKADSPKGGDDGKKDSSASKSDDENTQKKKTRKKTTRRKKITKKQTDTSDSKSPPKKTTTRKKRTKKSSSSKSDGGKADKPVSKGYSRGDDDNKGSSN